MVRARRVVALASLLVSLAAAAMAAEGAAGHGHMAGQGHDAMPGMTGQMQAMEEGLMHTQAFGEPGDPAKVTRTVEITAREIMFDRTEIAVKRGETVRIRITNSGEQPHEFTIGDAAYQESARAMMTHMTDMGIDVASPEHAAMHGQTGNTVTVPVGETGEVVWTFSREGDFEFSCNIPGHAEVGMKGAITVE